MLRRSVVSRSIMSSRPLVICTKTTSHCIPEEPTASPLSIPPSLSYSSSSDEPDETPRPRRASTKLISQNAADMKRIIGEDHTTMIETCCGGGCCKAVTHTHNLTFQKIPLPDNDAFRAIRLTIGLIPSVLTSLPDLPPKTLELLPVINGNAGNISPAKSSPSDSAISLGSNEPIESTTELAKKETPEIDTKVMPPRFVKPHHPYDVFPATIFSARELTKPGAEKRTYHFDLDVSDYPKEAGVDFKVGGAIGVMAPNEPGVVDELMDLLSLPRFLRDRPVLLKTNGGRYPIIWGKEEARELVTTRRDLLTWCSDFQSYRPSKITFRLLAEYATDVNEKKVLMYLSSGEGQSAFCAFISGPHITMTQLLHAFPSSKPPLDHLLSYLEKLSPRFYSLSNDPQLFDVPNGCTRIIEIAVTVHETPNWRGGPRTGLGSGFFERKYHEWKAARSGAKITIPMFKGLMANAMAKEFSADGPMLLIGAGVGVAPFRGFVQRRLRNTNCANKVWVLQGIRDSLLDELYSGEWGVHEDEVKKVVESRHSGQKGKYVQDEVRHQADLVWYIINSLDGRIFVCGSSHGMGEGVEDAIIDVLIQKGNLSTEAAKTFLNLKADSGNYVRETW